MCNRIVLFWAYATRNWGYGSLVSSSNIHSKKCVFSCELSNTICRGKTKQNKFSKQIFCSFVVSNQHWVISRFFSISVFVCQNLRKVRRCFWRKIYNRIRSRSNWIYKRFWERYLYNALYFHRATIFFEFIPSLSLSLPI